MGQTLFKAERQHFYHISWCLWRQFSLKKSLSMFFGVHKFKITSVRRVICVLGMFKMKSKFRKCKKKLPKSFFWWDNCFSICCYKLCLLRRKYLSSAVNGLANSRNILHIIRETFSTWIAFTSINKYGKGVQDQLWTVLRHIYHITFRRVLWNRTF